MDISDWLSENHDEYEVAYYNDSLNINISPKSDGDYAIIPLFEKKTAQLSVQYLFINIMTKETFISSIEEFNALKKDSDTSAENGRKLAWVSDKCTNVLDANGYEDITAEILPDGTLFVNIIVDDKSLDSKNNILSFLGVDRDDLERGNNIQIFMQDYESLIKCFFSSYDKINWYSVVINKSYSYDNKEHTIRSIDEFYKWYYLGEDGKRR